MKYLILILFFPFNIFATSNFQVLVGNYWLADYVMESLENHQTFYNCEIHTVIKTLSCEPQECLKQTQILLKDNYTNQEEVISLIYTVPTLKQPLTTPSRVRLLQDYTVNYGRFMRALEFVLDINGDLIKMEFTSIKMNPNENLKKIKCAGEL